MAKHLIKGPKAPDSQARIQQTRVYISCPTYLPAFLSQTFSEHLLCARYVLEICNVVEENQVNNYPPITPGSNLSSG